MEESKWEEEGAPPRHRTWYMPLPRSDDIVECRVLFLVVWGEVFWVSGDTTSDGILGWCHLVVCINSSVGTIGWYDPSQRVVMTSGDVG